MLTPDDVHHNRTQAAAFFKQPGPVIPNVRSRHNRIPFPKPSGSTHRDTHNRRNCSLNRNRHCLKVVDRFRIDELEPLAVSSNGAEALREAFSELPHDPISGARKALHYLQHGGSADRFAASARRQLARNGRHSHDYKFTEAALENYREMSPTAWRDRILAASMAYFTGSATAPSPVSQEALELLG